jgi:hypothetical protein
MMQRTYSVVGDDDDSFRNKSVQTSKNEKEQSVQTFKDEKEQSVQTSKDEKDNKQIKL